MITMQDGLKMKARDADAQRMQVARERASKRMRVGKTARDRARGVARANKENKLARDEWAKDGGKFPIHTCNGKKSRALKGA